ncbi:MAG: ATP-binding protein [Egibacteraceae bacterium]
MRDAFGWDLDRYIYYGGYPGAAPLIDDHGRWSDYVLDSLVETTLSRDVLLLTRVDKPALLRQLFRLACDYSAQIVSYQKMVGQLRDAGNTTTLAHYLDLLRGAGLVTGLQKFSGARIRQRGSSPKLLVLNTGLMAAVSGQPLAQARGRPDVWGRFVESAVGAHLVNSGASATTEVFYWRDRGHEVDYVVRWGQSLAAVEVKSGSRRESLPGLDAFTRTFHPARAFVVGTGGVPLEEFLSSPADAWR